MIIQQSFDELPPKAYLLQVLDKTAKIFMTWKDLSRFYNKNSFKTSLRRLSDEGLLDYEETENDICIELVRWDD
jgi:hypothetical protein